MVFVQFSDTLDIFIIPRVVLEINTFNIGMFTILNFVAAISVLYNVAYILNQIILDYSSFL